MTHDVVLYLRTPLSRAQLAKIVSILEDPAENLVRKDAAFKALQLRAEDYVGKPAAVIDLLIAHPELMQRPLLVRGKRAIIGRPKERIAEFLSA